MTSEHAYKAVLSEKSAVREIQNCSGKQFDPEVVGILVDKVLHLAEQP